jgi:hypothetical protein
MDAYFPSTSVDLCDLLERRRSSDARPDVDHLPGSLLRQLQESGRETIARLLYPVDGVPFTIHRRGCGHRHAMDERVAPFRRVKAYYRHWPSEFKAIRAPTSPLGPSRLLRPVRDLVACEEKQTLIRTGVE